MFSAQFPMTYTVLIGPPCRIRFFEAQEMYTFITKHGIILTVSKVGQQVLTSFPITDCDPAASKSSFLGHSLKSNKENEAKRLTGPKFRGYTVDYELHICFNLQ